MNEVIEAMEQLADKLTERGNERRLRASRSYSKRTDAYKRSHAAGTAYAMAAQEIRETLNKVRGY